MRISNSPGPWKAIAFLTVVFFSILLVGCRSDVPTVETISATVTYEGSSIQAAGKVISDGGEEIHLQGFCLSSHSLPSTSDVVKNASGASASFSATLGDLEKNATYYVRAYAMNSVGIGYGEVIEVYTSALALAQTGAAQVLNTTEVILNATIDPLNSEIEVWFEVSCSGEAVRKVEVQKTGIQSASEVSARATGLTPGKVYNYAVVVKNAYGTASGENKTFRLPYEVVKDFDGNEYWTMRIGNQIWTVENLKTTRFLNGDPIPNIQPDNEWIAMKSPAYCYAKNDPELGKVYGALYNNYVGLDSRGLIEGYRTPTIQDYETLVSYHGGGTTAPRKLKSNTDDWHDGRKGDNSSGFNALPGGWRDEKSNAFSTLYYQASFQTTTPMEGVGVFYSAIIYGSNRDVMTGGANFKYVGYSIRLIKN